MAGIELWTVPVPIRESTFVGLDRGFERYNVETDLSQIPAFGFRRGATLPATLLADLQTNADGNVHRRLGSGRSGYFEEKYLKGVGRTLLAANWSSSDRYHSSGHLLPSAAARELLVSALLEGAGARSTINACESVLARDLVDLDRDWLAELRGPRNHLSPVDLKLQAITIKDGHFARPSNFLWSIDNVGFEPNWLASFLFAMRRMLGGSEARTLREDEISANNIVSALDASITRGLHAFAYYRRLGLQWESTHNNFTADGRFLDLEIPLVLGSPFVGWVGHGDDPRRGYWVGLEVVGYLRQMRQFVRSLRERLACLPTYRFTDPEAGFVEDLVAELDRTFGKGHPILDEATVVDRVTATIAAELGLPTQASQKLRSIVVDEIRVRGRMSDDEWNALQLVRLPHRWTSAENFPMTFWVPADFMDTSNTDFAGGLAFNAALRACDDAVTLEHYFTALERGRARVRAIGRELG